MIFQLLLLKQCYAESIWYDSSKNDAMPRAFHRGAEMITTIDEKYYNYTLEDTGPETENYIRTALRFLEIKIDITYGVNLTLSVNQVKDRIFPFFINNTYYDNPIFARCKANVTDYYVRLHNLSEPWKREFSPEFQDLVEARNYSNVNTSKYLDGSCVLLYIYEEGIMLEEDYIDNTSYSPSLTIPYRITNINLHTNDQFEYVRYNLTHVYEPIAYNHTFMYSEILPQILINESLILSADTTRQNNRTNLNFVYWGNTNAPVSIPDYEKYSKHSMILFAVGLYNLSMSWINTDTGYIDYNYTDNAMYIYALDLFGWPAAQTIFRNDTSVKILLMKRNRISGIPVINNTIRYGSYGAHYSFSSCELEYIHPTPTLNPTMSRSPEPLNDDSSLTTGEVIAITTGSVIGITALTIGGYFIYNKMSDMETRNSNEDEI